MNQAPTFEEFQKNRDHYLGRDFDKLSEVDNGSTMLNKLISRTRYEIEGYRCDTLEEVEKVAKNQGIPLRELDYRPQIMPIGGGKCDILVKFVSKNVREQRETWK